MGERATLLELAERCEQAKGPDTLLNVDIRAACFPNGGPPKLLRDFTASLDAALSLVPKGWQFIIDSDGCHCRMTRRGVDVVGFAVSMALALTAAALRAIAEHTPSADKEAA